MFKAPLLTKAKHQKQHDALSGWTHQHTVVQNTSRNKYKKQTFDKHSNVDESQRLYADWKKPASKSHIL